MTMVNSGLKGLTLQTLKYFYVIYGDKSRGFVQCEIIINVLVSSSHFIEYLVMGL